MAEPLTSTVLTKAVATAAAPALRSASKALRGKLNLGDRVSLPPRETLAQAAEWFGQHLGDWDKNGALSKPTGVTGYVLGPECVTLLEHMFALELSGRSAAGHALIGELRNGLRGYVTDTDEETVDALFSALKALVCMLAKEMGSPTPGQLDEKTQERVHKEAIEAYLSAIENQIARLSLGNPPEL